VNANSLASRRWILIVRTSGSGQTRVMTMLLSAITPQTCLALPLASCSPQRLVGRSTGLPASRSRGSIMGQEKKRLNTESRFILYISSLLYDIRVILLLLTYSDWHLRSISSPIRFEVDTSNPISSRQKYSSPSSQTSSFSSYSSFGK